MGQILVVCCLAAVANVVALSANGYVFPFYFPPETKLLVVATSAPGFNSHSLDIG